MWANKVRRISPKKGQTKCVSDKLYDAYKYSITKHESNMFMSRPREEVKITSHILGTTPKINMICNKKAVP